MIINGFVHMSIVNKELGYNKNALEILIKNHIIRSYVIDHKDIHIAQKYYDYLKGPFTVKEFMKITKEKRRRIGILKSHNFISPCKGKVNGEEVYDRINIINFFNDQYELSKYYYTNDEVIEKFSITRPVLSGWISRGFEHRKYVHNCYFSKVYIDEVLDWCLKINPSFLSELNKYNLVMEVQALGNFFEYNEVCDLLENTNIKIEEIVKDNTILKKKLNDKLFFSKKSILSKLKNYS